MKNWFSKILLGLVLTLFVASSTVSCVSHFTKDVCVSAASAVSGNTVGSDDVLDRLNGLFFPSIDVGNVDEVVYLGGYPLGMTIDGNGVTVVGLNEFVASDGDICCPAIDSGLQIGDIVVEIEGTNIYNSAKLVEIANKSNGSPIRIKYIRSGKIYSTQITPQKDVISNSYKLGLWTKDSSSGIGTLTYIRRDFRFGSLGHPILDANSNIVKTTDGGVYKCTINSIIKGQRGAAGELRGGFSFEDRIGSIYANNKYGVYGTISDAGQYTYELIDVASVREVTPGKALIYTTLDDNVRRAYEIEIIKASAQRTMDDKGMVLRVTDKRLLESTGGIVQGMSGSPIVQNGKLVGAVTHVFVNDPTKGYGIYAQWMLEN
ncbi:MAG: SpoIVB peptidase [Corallococcus sp.]|nr:SpoIVB peptidase [Corallococcus sp.]